MALANGQFWFRWTSNYLLLAIIGLIFHVNAWTYHYGAKSDLSWESARKFCQTWYTDLVAIQNKEEIAYLNAVLPQHSKYYWIGIRKINNIWTWVGTGKALTKEEENWAYREPNNKLSNQDCVEIYIKRNFEAGKWNDEPCSKKKRALCYKASCQTFCCNERSACVETIGNYTCQCFPGFYGPDCENVVKCSDFGILHQALRLNCTHPLEDFSYRSSCNFSCNKGFTITGPATLQCLSSGQWTADVPQCAAIQCQPLNVPANGDFSCFHIYGEFQFQSSCNFKCKEGFQISGEETIVCEASGRWSSLEPVCHAVQCQHLEVPIHGNSTCAHLHGTFQYQSNCTFHCMEGFLLHGKDVTECTASGEWKGQVPVCQVIECPKLFVPENGGINCSHPYGDFAYGSSCFFSCDKGFVPIGKTLLQCTSLGKWTEIPPLCEVMQCNHLQCPRNGEIACYHPTGEFAYQSTCEFACEPGFALAGANTTHCLATGHWSAPLPACQVIKCPKLDPPQNGELNCTDPHGSFAYNSSCSFSCDRGFIRVGTVQLLCTALEEWTAATPVCEAIQCPPLNTPENGKEDCSNPHGDFAYNSNCTFSCNSGFELTGPEKLSCMDQGNWTGETPICDAIKCPPLREMENMETNCSHPWSSFSYRSTCWFHCAKGFILNGTSRIQCLPDGHWSAEMPICQEHFYLKEVLLYTGSVTASMVAVMILGGLIALAIKRLNKREERKKLLSHTSDLGVPGVYCNSAYELAS